MTTELNTEISQNLCFLYGFCILLLLFFLVFLFVFVCVFGVFFFFLDRFYNTIQSYCIVLEIQKYKYYSAVILKLFPQLRGSIVSHLRGIFAISRCKLEKFQRTK